jgi:hypothetical protein
LARLLVVALLLGVLVSGCGKKADPVPPVAPPPSRPVGVALGVKEDAPAISWGWPQGAPMPLVFRLMRASPDEGCPECPLKWAPVGDVQAKTAGPFELRDGSAVPGSRYLYQVVPEGMPAGSQAAPSEPLHVAWRALPPPDGVLAVVQEAGVRIIWEPREMALEYEVYRAEGDKPFDVLGRLPSPPFFDQELRPGAVYRYGVASVDRTGPGPMSAPSEVIVGR